MNRFAFSKSSCDSRILAMALAGAMIFGVLALAGGAGAADSPSLETLLAYLKSPSEVTRRDAAHKIGERRIHDRSAVEALAVACRKDEDQGVRAEAVRSLGMIKDLSALDDMLGCLSDHQSDVRRAAIKALVALYTEQHIDFITNTREGWNLLNPFLDTDDREIVEPYIEVDASIIAALGRTARGDDDLDTRIAGIRALGVLRGRDAIPDLAKALADDRDVRIDVIRTFIKISDPSAGQYLIPYFRDSDQKIRTQAMVAAGILKYKPAVEPLMTVYGLGPEHSGPVARVAHEIRGRFSYLPPRDEAALWALSLIGDPASEQLFVENMDDKDSDRRQYGIEGLARVGEPRYLDQISRAVLTERSSDVKLAEHWAMYKMGSRGELQTITRKLDSSQNEQAHDYLLEVNSPADLYPYIHSSKKEIRRDVIEILGEIGDQDTVAELKPVAEASGRATSDAATVAIKRIEWRIAGRPNASDRVLQRGDTSASRPRRVSGP